MGTISTLYRTLLLSFVILVFFLFLGCAICFAQDTDTTQPVLGHYGFAITGGTTYTPGGDIQFALLSGIGLFNHPKMWGRKPPEQLKLKVELTAGVTSGPYTRLITSANIFHLYYLRCLDTKFFHPYVEGGIGIIYTDFQVEGQGLRVNFNPQLGIGTEYHIGDTTWFSAIRLYHVSNGGLNHENTGINAVTLSLGLFFR